MSEGWMSSLDTPILQYSITPVYQCFESRAPFGANQSMACRALVR